MTVRTIAESDIAAATVLIGQLGYEMPQQEFARRLTAVLTQADHHVWVYEDGGRVVELLGYEKKAASAQLWKEW